ncbi:MAG: acetyl-CoA carboxylase biotin carboxyl carrier protein [Oscillospiraceae bacterium]|nr:acetyl-CoA carboxylase biotin carboxyl carrier protein [Oscillospiraceae bacterium]
MADILEMLEQALKLMPDATRICVEKDDELIEIERGGKSAFIASEGGYSTPPLPRPAPDVESGVTPALVGNEFVKAPLVGVFYASPAPDAPPFVKAGQKVKKGDPICIIEAMKMMNEIESPLDGTVAVVLAENGEMVEFGQPLFEIRTV